MSPDMLEPANSPDPSTQRQNVLQYATLADASLTQNIRGYASALDVSSSAAFFFPSHMSLISVELLSAQPTVATALRSPLTLHTIWAQQMCSFDIATCRTPV